MPSGQFPQRSEARNGEPAGMLFRLLRLIDARGRRQMAGLVLTSSDWAGQVASYATIRQLPGLRTTVIVAHRASTLECCQMIYQVADGQAERL